MRSCYPHSLWFRNPVGRYLSNLSCNIMFNGQLEYSILLDRSYYNMFFSPRPVCVTVSMYINTFLMFQLCFFYLYLSRIQEPGRMCFFGELALGVIDKTFTQISWSGSQEMYTTYTAVDCSLRRLSIIGYYYCFRVIVGV